jgi:acid phosphatase (class A)
MRHAFLLFAFVPVLLYGQTSRPKGYLSPVDVQSLIVLIPPPPEENDVRDVVDQDVFLRTRGAKDTPRWAIARKDVDISVGGLMRAFSCTFGEATPKQQPHLAALLARVSSDSFALFDSLKIYYKKKRPFLIHDGPVCVDKKEIAKTYDYPSGHSTVGYTTGLILADLNVAKAPAILGRARQFGESRIFCGVHNASAVEAGRVLGAALFAMLQGVPEFRADLEAARAELAAGPEKAGEDKASCEADAAVLAASPYKNLPTAKATE